MKNKKLLKNIVFGFCADCGGTIPLRNTLCKKCSNKMMEFVNKCHQLGIKLSPQGDD